MYFDRGALKRRAKHLVTQGNPQAYMVTLIFLLATTALATVVGLFLPNPVDQVDALYLNWFNTIMENGGEISQGSMNALTCLLYTSSGIENGKKNMQISTKKCSVTTTNAV